MGDMRLYRQERPFFLGLILGYFSGIAAANTSDFIWFNGQGNSSTAFTEGSGRF